MKKVFLFYLILIFSSSIGAKDLETDVYRRNSLCNFFIGESDVSNGYGQMVGDCLLKYVMSDKFNDHCLSQKFMSIANTQYTKDELNAIYPSSKQKKDNLLRSLDNQLISSVNSNSTNAQKKSAATLKAQWEKKDRRHEFGARALHWLNENHIASLLVAQWFNAKAEKVDGSHYDMQLIQDRGAYNASELEKLRSKESVRGDALLKDAGMELIPNTYVTVTYFTVKTAKEVSQADDWDSSWTTTMFEVIRAVNPAWRSNADVKAFWVESTTFLFKLIWDEETENKFLTEYWDQDYNKLATSNDFSLKYMGYVESNGCGYPLPGKENDDVGILSMALYDAIDNGIAKLQKEYEDFKIKVPLIEVNGKDATAFIGLKEGLEKNTKFEVLERVCNEKSNIFRYKKVGNLKIDKSRVWENREMIEGIKRSQSSVEPNPDVDRTYLLGANGSMAPGMLIRQTK
jgi:nuclear transport factor 2 (NTF2) superfamily protein